MYRASPYFESTLGRVLEFRDAKHLANEQLNYNICTYVVVCTYIHWMKTFYFRVSFEIMAMLTVLISFAHKYVGTYISKYYVNICKSFEYFQPVKFYNKN